MFNKKCGLLLTLLLLLVSVGSVCATDNTTSDNITGDGGLNPVNPPITNTTDIVKMVNSELEKRDNIIQNQELRIKNLENSSAEKDIRINELNNTVNSLKIDNEALKDNNTQLNKRVKILEDSNKQLVDSNKQLVDSNKVLNNTVNNQAVKINELKADNKVLNDKVNNQSVIINELNNKLELQFIEINKLQADKDKLNAEIKQLNAEKCSIYEKLLSSPKKEDYEQLKKDITNKDNLINELNTKIDNLNNEIKTLKAINSVSRNDVVNSLKALSSTKNIQCGKYTFKLDDYLKIPLIKNGKKNVLKFKKDNGRLPNYVIIGDYKVPQKVYKKLYNL